MQRKRGFVKLKEWLAEEDFQLVMSSGYFGFFAHAGFCLALVEEGLEPKSISGSSAGAIVGAFFAAGMHPRSVLELLQALRKEHFWDAGFSNLSRHGGYLRGELYRNHLDEILPLKTFAELPLELSVSAYHLRSRKTRVFRSGSLSDSVRASSAVPILFAPVQVEGERYWDGGILDRAGLGNFDRVDPPIRSLLHYLPSRFAFRRKRSPQMDVPRTNNAVCLYPRNLPRLDPNRLAGGEEAFWISYTNTKRALERTVNIPVNEGTQLVVIDAP